ncbi:hypothetical protein RCS94_03585 [Orbaceae bacterium ac157xtp]
MNKIVLLGAIIAIGLSGCATKNYGRQGELTQYERDKWKKALQ